MRAMRLFFSVLVLAGCASDPTDVRPTIQSADLSVEGERLVGTVDVHFESFGEVDLTISDPRLVLGSPDGYVDGVQLVFPEDFDPVFSPGETRDVTFDIDDQGGWSSFCGSNVKAEIDMKAEKEAGNVIVSLGAAVDLTLSCSL